MDQSEKGNKAAAILWFVVAFSIAAIGLYALFTPGWFLAAPLLSFSLIFIYLGRQYLAAFKLKPENFRKKIFGLAIFCALTAALGATIGANA